MEDTAAVVGRFFDRAALNRAFARRRSRSRRTKRQGLAGARPAAPIRSRASAVVVTGSGEMVSPLRGEYQ